MIVGVSFSATVLFAILSQPFASVTVTLYGPAPTLIFWSVLLLLQFQLSPSLARKVTILSGQTLSAPIIVASSTANCPTVISSVPVQPFASLTTTLYIPAPTFTLGPVALPVLADHWKPIAPPPCIFAFNWVCRPGQTLGVPEIVAIGLGLMVKLTEVRGLLH